jgi:hypothetical protein
LNEEGRVFDGLGFFGREQDHGPLPANNTQRLKG